MEFKHIFKGSWFITAYSCIQTLRTASLRQVLLVLIKTSHDWFPGRKKSWTFLEKASLQPYGLEGGKKRKKQNCNLELQVIR